MKNIAIVGTGLDSASVARAMRVLDRQPGVVGPKFMQNQNAQPTVVVDDTKPPVDPELQVKPKRSCPHCYGRGHVGTDTATGKKIVCRCVNKDFVRVNKLQKEIDAKLKPSTITRDAGWDAPKAPTGKS